MVAKFKCHSYIIELVANNTNRTLACTYNCVLNENVSKVRNESLIIAFDMYIAPSGPVSTMKNDLHVGVLMYMLY